MGGTFDFERHSSRRLSAGPHRIELSMMKVEDPNSPITKQFSGRNYGSIDEHYHFPGAAPYTRAETITEPSALASAATGRTR